MLSSLVSLFLSSRRVVVFKISSGVALVKRRWWWWRRWWRSPPGQLLHLPLGEVQGVRVPHHSRPRFGALQTDFLLRHLCHLTKILFVIFSTFFYGFICLLSFRFFSCLITLLSCTKGWENPLDGHWLREGDRLNKPLHISHSSKKNNKTKCFLDPTFPRLIQNFQIGLTLCESLLDSLMFSFLYICINSNTKPDHPFIQFLY